MKINKHGVALLFIAVLCILLKIMKPSIPILENLLFMKIVIIALLLFLVWACIKIVFDWRNKEISLQQMIITSILVIISLILVGVVSIGILF
ncbi:MAG: hypothetical protein PUK21_02635 [Peptostreptococcaceae bacterium]|nr:hypothetical protein [Peptostreptococcaceae bacterium]MDY5739471.1 hypothetical protein [Anaerovoracaceae bacterium]